jgi:prolyl-tRNA synthetase
VERLKALKLTIRNVPLGSPTADGTCIFTGAPAVERVLLAKAY